MRPVTVGDLCLYHDTGNGKDEVIEVRVLDIAPAWTTGTIPVKVRHRGCDFWVPKSLLCVVEEA